MTPGRISVIWPYWMRGEAMLRGLASMEQHYGGRDDVEIVVVDDGSPSDRAITTLMTRPSHTVGGPGLRVEVRNLEIKQGPKNPCVPINRGVAASTGEFVVLTNPETTHRAPIFDAMREELRQLGPDGYVLAAAWCPQSQSWHCHSTWASAGYHFCTMLRRELFDRAGGFDEDYRDGYCFDDPDWVQRLLRVGARFKFRDDLVVDHHKDGATHTNSRELWDRNEKMFRTKWPDTKDIHGQSLTNERLQNWR